MTRPKLKTLLIIIQQRFPSIWWLISLVSVVQYFFLICALSLPSEYSDDSDIGLKWYFHWVLRYLMILYSEYLHANHLGVHFYFFSPNLTSVYVELLKWSRNRVLAKSKPHFTYVSIFGWNFALNYYFTSMFLFMHSCV